MASARKKQDEKNMKTLRDLGALPQNKYCFDCGQRGPTYVDVTIGSFVCTKCSGLLRGLTPPHRVKSISMATFATDEVDILKNRGNDYCRSVWLGLYEGTQPESMTMSRDEQVVRDFMVEKYEKKRYFLDPAQALRNGHASSSAAQKMVADNSSTSNGSSNHTNGGSGSSIISSSNRINNNVNKVDGTNRKRPEVHRNHNNQYQIKLLNSGGTTTTTTGGFAVNFDNADIFAADSTNNGNSANKGSGGNSNGVMTNGIAGGQESFANFDDNPVFSNNANGKLGMPSAAFDAFNFAQQPSNITTTAAVINLKPPATVEDKYAALKDLDNALKSQNNVNGGAGDWNSSSSVGGSNGSLYSSPTPTASMYSSPSPQGSMFGSPSQGQFVNGFTNHHTTENGVFNPFNNGSNSANSAWGSSTFNNSNNGFINNSNNQNNIKNNSNGTTQSLFPNPFKVTNGFTQPPAPTATNFQPAVFPMSMNGASSPWAANPFKAGTPAIGGGGMQHNPNNPFL